MVAIISSVDGGTALRQINHGGDHDKSIAASKSLILGGRSHEQNLKLWCRSLARVEELCLFADETLSARCNRSDGVMAQFAQIFDFDKANAQHLKHIFPRGNEDFFASAYAGTITHARSTGDIFGDS